MEQGDTIIFTLSQIDAGDDPPRPLAPQEEDKLAQHTIHFWREWLSQCTYEGRWREIVYRSALVMKLLTYKPTGAIIAAPTTSLPEKIGGERNWDYRYSWLRDAAFTLYGFLRIGFTEEAGAFIEWLRKRIHEPHEGNPMPLQIMYTIDGDHDIPERHLDHLEGYRNSKPVRIGNAAHDQLQLDIFGELLDSIYLYNKYGQKISYEFWQDVKHLANWVADNWQQQDKGIWEIRGVDQPFTYSKLMCWVALDRAARLAEKRSLPAPRSRWLNERDKIYREIIERGWNEDIGAFVQYYGSDTLDAGNLLMPLVFFMAPSDPMMINTIEAIMRPPREGGLLADSLVYRYDTAVGVDGLEGEEGTFNMCTFWLVEALTRAGRIDEARRIFEQMLAYANHLGLYAEETGIQGEALGNFPQAFTHLSLISAAYNLDLALDGKKWV
jgi:GH15 family glucan-1,4-alpha-glucosidase